MNHELICAWLGLPAGAWPPDHHRLLGLEPGETDVRVIELRVQQRLDSVRRYQMTHPDLATEAMNRLAQALVSLTAAPSLRPTPQPPPLPRQAPAPSPPTYSVDVLPEPVHAADWHTPPPVRKGLPEAPAAPPGVTPPPLPSLPALLAATATSGVDPTAPQEVSLLAPPPVRRRPSPQPEPPRPKIDPAEESARAPEARSGLGTIRAVCRRARRTRQLLLAWDRLGVYLATRRRLRGADDEDELHDSLAETQRLLRRFPPVLGNAGQPAYLIASLSAQQDPVATYRQLQGQQLVALQRDWRRGRQVLRAHHAFLLDELRALRRLGRRERIARAVRAMIADQPVVAAALFVLLLVNVVIWSAYLPFWLRR